MAMPDEDYRQDREAMVESQIRARGISSPKVLDAMRRVRREMFVPAEVRPVVYEDSAQRLAAGQTISQPYIVAVMVDALTLQGGERVLDIGTGSGYAAAVIACIAGEVFSIERIGELADSARHSLKHEGFDNVHVRTGDGSKGWPQHAPFDAIMVAAGAPVVPESLKRQLAIGGRLVIPVGDRQTVQQLVRITRVSEHEYQSTNLDDVRFVPLLGEESWSPDSR